MTSTNLPAAAGHSEPNYVAWMRARQQHEHRQQPLISQRHAKNDASESPDVHAQEMVWAERHAHELRLHDSAIAQLRRGSGLNGAG
ncbi:MAG: hypothetical protein EBX49_04475 [Synechococcaceae bacterium WB8_1B_136]|nr:hypothetical protein [Synechococcaceae bacterium WB8_1B_136]